MTDRRSHPALGADLTAHAWLALLLGVAACAVDERTLEKQPPALPSGSGGTGSTGGTTSVPEGGAAGDQGTDGEGLVEGCADLDTDGVPDCEVTLAQNPTFTSDVEGWKALGEAELNWQAENAFGDHPSGSAELTTDTEMRASAYQCVPLEGAALVIAYASTFVDPGDDAEQPSKAELEVTFFRGEGCSGASDGYFVTPPSTVTGAWTTVQAGNVSKDTTLSASIELVGLKSASAATLSIYFDNVMVKMQAPSAP